MKKFSLKPWVIILILLLNKALSQTNYHEILGQDKLRAITSAVPFLLIAPDARGGALGDASVASTPDVNSMHYNPAKYAFIDKDFGVSISYSPWLRGLVNDINLGYLSVYKKFPHGQALAASLRYFSLGDIIFTNNLGDVIGEFKPNEFAIDVAYARKFTEKISAAMSLRYINSNLTGGITVEGAQTQVGQSVATDVAFFYTTNFSIANYNSIFSFGTNISNIGFKMSYTEEIGKDFIPINLKLGPTLTVDFDEYNTISFLIDINKLLIPTPPVYGKDEQGNYVIIKGKDPDRSVVSGMFGSFTDAPDGFKEEIKEFNYSLGIEYWYDKRFAIRGGFFHEHPYKGNRQFFTLGAGFKLNVFALDFAYLIPTEQKHPLENTLRFTLIFDFEGLKKEK